MFGFELLESPARRYQCPISTVVKIALVGFAYPIKNCLDGLALRLIDTFLYETVLQTFVFAIDYRSAGRTIFREVNFVELSSATFANSNHDVAFPNCR